MKKLVVTFVVMFFSISFISAQQKEANSSFKPGWYLGANAGVNWFLGEGNNFITPSPFVFGIGKNAGFLGRFSAEYKFTPVVGLRGMLGYHQHNWYTTAPTLLNPNGTKTVSFGSENLTADFMLNLSNWWAGYRPERKMDFSLFAGLGAGFMNSNTVESPIAFIGRGGLQADYHLNPDWTLNLMLEGNVVGDNYNDNGAGPLFVDLMPALSVGFNYRMPEKQKKVMSESLSSLADNTSNAKKDTVVADKVVKNDLADNAVKKDVVKDVKVADKDTVALADNSKKTTETKKEAVVTTPIATSNNGLNEKIFFSINNVAVSESKHGKALDQVAEFVKQHPNAIITVSGYADKSTGSVITNNHMSKQRAVSVANALIRFYGVSYKNVVVKWYGGGVQPFSTASKNRLTIVKSPAQKGSTTTQVDEKAKTEVIPTASVDKKQAAVTEEVAPDYFGSVTFAKTIATTTEAKQLASIEEIAQYMIKYPTVKILISGYSDKSTGSTTKNAELAKQRAIFVSNTLIQKYKIKYDRIQTKWYGVAQSTDPTTSMNGIVLIEKMK